MFGLIFSAAGVLATDSGPTELSGIGTVAIANTAPGVSIVPVNDTTQYVTAVDVNTYVLFYVNVSDANSLDDIKEVQLDINVGGFQNADDPIRHYQFTYTETMANNNGIAGTWAQVQPTAADNYLNTCTAPTDPTASSGSYVFNITLNKTAKAGNWESQGKATDDSASVTNSGVGGFAVYKYLEMTYTTGATMNFGWAGAEPGDTNLQEAFSVQVTANTPYTLAAAYDNMPYNSTAGMTWGEEPSLEVVHSSTRRDVTNFTAVGYVDWYTSTGGGFNTWTSHTMELDIPATLRKLTYTGMTIYIRASV